jgi:hypothetical protein
MNGIQKNEEKLTTSGINFEELKLIKIENKSKEEETQIIAKVTSEIEEEIKSFDNETQKELNELIESLKKHSPDLWYLISKIYNILQNEKDSKNIKNNTQSGGNANSFVVDKASNHLGPTIVRINKNHIQSKTSLIMSIIVFVLSALMLIETAMQHGENVNTFISSLYEINKEDTLIGIIFKLLISNQSILQKQIKDVIENFPTDNIKSPFLVTTGVYTILNIGAVIFNFTTGSSVMGLSSEIDYLTEATEALKLQKMAEYKFSIYSLHRSVTKILPVNMLSLLMISMNVGLIKPENVVKMFNNLLGVVTNRFQLVYEDTPMAIENNSTKQIMNVNQSGGKQSRKKKSKYPKKSKKVKQTRKK